MNSMLYVFRGLEFYGEHHDEKSILSNLNFMRGLINEDRIESIGDIKNELYIKACSNCNSLDLLSQVLSPKISRLADGNRCLDCDKVVQTVVYKVYPRWRWKNA